jgi:putative hydroxymethylpyrimidine transport system substrate-binding protein
MKSIRLIPLLVAAIALLAGCGGGADAETSGEAPEQIQKFDVTLDGYPNPENVGITMANARGYFYEAGLEILVHTPVDPLRPIGYALNGSADVSIASQPQVVLEQEKGVPIVAIGSVLPEPTAAMIWLKDSKIEDVADLKGKTIAIPGLDFQRSLLEPILAQAGLTLEDVKVETVGYELVPALTSGRADAIFGGSWDVEGIELEDMGLEPVITRVQDLGIPAYEELVFVARRSRLAKDPESIRDFLSAVARGTEEAIDDPEDAADVVLGRNEYRSTFEATEAGLGATLPLLSTSGEMSIETAEGLIDWMHEEGLIQQQPPASDLLTDDYLP